MNVEFSEPMAAANPEPIGNPNANIAIRNIAAVLILSFENSLPFNSPLKSDPNQRDVQFLYDLFLLQFSS